MKRSMPVALLAVLFFTGCKQEVQLRDKLAKDGRYDVEVFHVKPVFGQPRIELRDKKDSSLIASKTAHESSRVEYCWFFFHLNDAGTVLDVCVNTGTSEWRWTKEGNKDWVLYEETR